MATTVHIPDALLRRLDERAKALGVSRNRLIVEAVEAKLVTRHGWPPELHAVLSQTLDAATAESLDDSVAVVRRQRRSRKGPPRL